MGNRSGSPAERLPHRLIGAPGDAGAVREEQRRGGRDAGPEPVLEVSAPAPPTASERASASKRSRSSPRLWARSHRCGSSRRPWSANSASCIGQNAPCCAGGLGRAGRRPGARMAWSAPGSGGSTPARVVQPQVERRAVRALEVRVDDHQRGALRPAQAVVGVRGRGWRRAQVGQARRRRSPSKIRLAPGRSPGEAPRSSTARCRRAR